MGTRSGDLDPGVLFYFLQQKQLNALQLAELLNVRPVRRIGHHF